jgi:hypothetical protein
MSTFEGSGRFINDGLVYYVDFANKDSFSPNMINYSIWATGSGSISASSSLYGSSGFNLNGSSDETVRFLSDDPFGYTQSVIWKSNSADAIDGRTISGTTSLTSAGDGGWDGIRFSIDPTKMYRFSVWTKRDAMTVGSTYSGSFYLGVYAYGSDFSLHTVWSKIGTTTSNPYFHVTSNPYPSTLASISPPNLGGLNVWALVVGHVWPAGTATGSFVVGSNVNGLALNYNHQDSGIWTRAGGKVGNSTSDWIWSATASKATLRTYLFYSSDVTATQSFVYPRVDLIDGTEPTIQQLLTGAEPVKNLITNGSNAYSTSLNDIVYSNSTNFSNEKNGCIIFDPIKRNNIQGTISTTFSVYSASIWFNTAGNIGVGSTGTTLFQFRVGTSYVFDLYLGEVTGLVTNEVITLATTTQRTAVTDITITGNTWNNIILNWESTSYAIYLNGVKQTTTSGTSTNVTLNNFVNYLVIGARLEIVSNAFGSYFNGKMSSFAVWQKTLSESEILSIYSKGKSKLGI